MNLERMKNKTVAIIAMVLSSLITIADGFFIGNYIGKEGIAAVYADQHLNCHLQYRVGLFIHSLVSIGDRRNCCGFADLADPRNLLHGHIFPAQI